MSDPNGNFYCMNIGSSPKFVYASRVNDRICDCCDGSDEYQSSIHCPNTCIMGGNVNYIYKTRTNRKSSVDTKLGSTTDPKESKTVVNLQDMVKNLQSFVTYYFPEAILRLSSKQKTKNRCCLVQHSRKWRYHQLAKEDDMDFGSLQPFMQMFQRSSQLSKQGILEPYFKFLTK